MKNQGILKVWERFKMVFLEKYFTDSLRANKEFEFQQLQEGSMFVAKYAEKFEDMVVYSNQAL